jgi:hypothetical protein
MTKRFKFETHEPTIVSVGATRSVRFFPCRRDAPGDADSGFLDAAAREAARGACLLESAVS